MKQFINAPEGTVCGLIGEHLSHSFSPSIHACFADYPYVLKELAPSELKSFFESTELSAFNVTIPYKKAVIPYLADISDAARAIGAVNTVVKRPDGTFYGDNTDYYGFSMMLNSANIDVQGKKALILGSGGASVTVNAVLRDAGIGELITVSRSGAVNYNNVAELHSDAEIVVNCTPVGMYPNNGACALNLAKFTKLRAVFDLIYNPARTALLLDAEELNRTRNEKIICRNGLLMLVAQAKRACEIFVGETLCDSVIDRTVLHLKEQTENLILIGMPGCGKSTAAKNISRLTGKRFVDTDELILKYSDGLTPAQCIERLGVDKFRELESMAVSEIGKESGLIIATGGGVPTIEKNYRSLHQNGVIVRIDRPLAHLSVKGRPLSQGRSLEKLYEERLPAYLRFADVTVESQKDPMLTAKAVLAAYSSHLNS